MIRLSCKHEIKHALFNMKSEIQIDTSSYLAKNHCPGRYLQDLRGKMGRETADHKHAVEDTLSKFLQVGLGLQVTVQSESKQRDLLEWEKLATPSTTIELSASGTLPWMRHWVFGWIKG